jgi:hypothetical protein
MVDGKALTAAKSQLHDLHEVDADELIRTTKKGA